MQEKFNSIVRIFPDLEEKIDFLLQTDENFRDLCSDHILCVAMVKSMRARLTENTAGIEEYEDLQRNLEQEILETIMKDKHDP